VAKAEKKRPWLKFYPQDWRGDPKLRMCSIGARGLWAEMICLMHEAEPYGHLMVNNTPVTNRQLASLAGISQSDCMKFMAELESSGVYSRQPNKTIFSRRMVRDNEKSLQGKNDIGKRWANRPDGRSPTDAPNRSPNRSPTQDPITLEVRSQKENATLTHARGGLISPEAFELADRLEKACGFSLPEQTPVGWAGCAMWAQKCLSDGWIADVMVEAAKGVARRKRNGFIESFKYLEKPLAEAMAQHLQPLPEVEIKPAEKVTVISNDKRESLAAVAARLAESGVTFGIRPRGLRAEAGGDDVRLLSKG